MSYHWWFNSSAHTKHELYTSSLNAAQNLPGTFTYMVNTSADYGWVQCSGANSVGRQTKPCLFHILPADKPSPVKACEVTNVTYDSLTLNCTPGHDGGIRQTFVLELYDASTGQLLTNVSSESAEFVVSGVSASGALTVAVRAINKKGASNPFTMSSSLLKYPERHTALVPVRVELSVVLLVVVAAVGIVLLITSMSAAVFCCRHCKHNNNKSEKDKRRQDGTSNVPLTGTKESQSVDSLDKNPDIIPLDGKLSDNSSLKSSDYSTRPLISCSAADKYGAGDKYNSLRPGSAERFACERPGDHCQYMQVRPMEYRIRPSYQPSNILPMRSHAPSPQSVVPPPTLAPFQNLSNVGTDCQFPRPPSTFAHLSNVGTDCHLPRPPYDNVYED